MKKIDILKYFLLAITAFIFLCGLTIPEDLEKDTEEFCMNKSSDCYIFAAQELDDYRACFVIGDPMDLDADENNILRKCLQDYILVNKRPDLCYIYKQHNISSGSNDTCITNYAVASGDKSWCSQLDEREEEICLKQFEWRADIIQSSKFNNDWSLCKNYDDQYHIANCFGYFAKKNIDPNLCLETGGTSLETKEYQTSLCIRELIDYTGDIDYCEYNISDTHKYLCIAKYSSWTDIFKGKYVKNNIAAILSIIFVLLISFIVYRSSLRHHSEKWAYVVPLILPLVIFLLSKLLQWIDLLYQIGYLHIFLIFFVCLTFAFYPSFLIILEARKEKYFSSRLIRKFIILFPILVYVFLFMKSNELESSFLLPAGYDEFFYGFEDYTIWFIAILGIGPSLFGTITSIFAYVITRIKKGRNFAGALNSRKTLFFMLSVTIIIVAYTFFYLSALASI